MKKMAMFCAFAFLFSGCGQAQAPNPNPPMYTADGIIVYTILKQHKAMIDGHEYFMNPIQTQWGVYTVWTHNGNCQLCQKNLLDAVRSMELEKREIITNTVTITNYFKALIVENKTDVSNEIIGDAIKTCPNPNVSTNK